MLRFGSGSRSGFVVFYCVAGGWWFITARCLRFWLNLVCCFGCCLCCGIDCVGGCFVVNNVDLLVLWVV